MRRRRRDGAFQRERGVLFAAAALLQAADTGHAPGRRVRVTTGGTGFGGCWLGECRVHDSAP